MEPPISRTQKKRLAKGLENLAKELVELPKVNIEQLPCDDFLKEEILEAKTLKGGSRKRQIKYISKNLRQIDAEPLFDFLANKKGSKLKKTEKFHELERLRDEIISEVFDELRQAEKAGERLDSNWESSVIAAIVEKYQTIDSHALKEAATKFAITKKPLFKREIFRILKAGQENQSYR